MSSIVATCAPRAAVSPLLSDRFSYRNARIFDFRRLANAAAAGTIERRGRKKWRDPSAPPVSAAFERSNGASAEAVRKSGGR
jgi:hypothetical protein